jgi:hypothetical protein
VAVTGPGAGTDASEAAVVTAPVGAVAETAGADVLGWTATGTLREAQ